MEGFTEAIKTATGNEEMKKKSAAMSEKIRSEDGIGNAVKIIDKYPDS